MTDIELVMDFQKQIKELRLEASTLEINLKGLSNCPEATKIIQSKLKSIESRKRGLKMRILGIMYKGGIIL